VGGWKRFWLNLPLFLQPAYWQIQEWQDQPCGTALAGDIGYVHPVAGRTSFAVDYSFAAGTVSDITDGRIAGNSPTWPTAAGSRPAALVALTQIMFRKWIAHDGPQRCAYRSYQSSAGYLAPNRCWLSALVGGVGGVIVVLLTI
jgi:hypothetical protein